MGGASTEEVCQRAGLPTPPQLIGRAREMDVIERLVVEPSHTHLVVLHGPVGVGKTSLLHSFTQRCDAKGVSWTWHEGSLPRPEEIASAVPECLELDGSRGKDRRVAVILDCNATPATMDALIHHSAMTDAPAGLLLVVTSRREPSQRLLLHPHWGRTMRSLRLQPLPPPAAHELLNTLGVPDEEHDGALAFAGGSPLLLRLAGHHANERGTGLCSFGKLDDAVRSLLPLLEDRGGTTQARRALRACAMARRTTPELLGTVLGDLDEAERLFRWLGGLTFIDDTAEGLRMQDVPRRAVVQELRAHYPGEFMLLHRQIKEYCASQVARSVDGHRWIACAFYLDQQVSELRHYLVWEDDPVCRHVEVARSADWDALHHATLEHEGETSAQLLKHWAEAIPESIEVVRGADRTAEGLIVTLPLDRHLVQAHIGRDPAIDTILAYMEGKGAAEDEPWGIVHRFWMDHRTYQRPSPVLTELIIHMVARALGVQHLPFSFAVTRDLAAWLRFTRILDIPAEAGGDFSVDGLTYSLLAVDWRATDRADWMFRFVQRPMDEIGELWWKRVAGSARVTSGCRLRDTMRPGTGPGLHEDASTGPGGLGDLIMGRMRKLAREAELTKRESEVLDLLLLGRNTEEIALVLDIAPRTAKFHQGNVLRKLGADSKADLVRLLL
jgi:DNA-binding CsgD family transcriptional regulator